MNLTIPILVILFLFLFFILVTYIISLFKKQKMPMSEYETNLPYVSIIIPAYNEENNILSCLNSILKSDYELDKLQVVVVNDQSEDNTEEVVQRFMKEHRQLIDMKLVNGLHQGKSKTLNLGISSSKHDLVLTIDADIIISENTIKELVKPMFFKDVAATNSVAFIKNPSNAIEQFQRIEYFLNNLIRVSFSRVFENSIWFFGAVACYKKKILEKIGYFKKDTLTEDMDICLEMYNLDYKIITSTKAIITTKACSTLKDLFKQRMRWYYGALQALVKNKKLLHVNKSSPSVYFLFFNQFWWTFYSFIFLPIVVYQVKFWYPPLEQGFFAAFSYLFRWFSLSGPFYVLYKMPEWGLSLLNIFGVSAGIITFILSIIAIKSFKGKITLQAIISMFFYFPYTIVINLIIVFGVIKYSFSKKKYFID